MLLLRGLFTSDRQIDLFASSFFFTNICVGWIHFSARVLKQACSGVNCSCPNNSGWTDCSQWREGIRGRCGQTSRESTESAKARKRFQLFLAMWSSSVFCADRSLTKFTFLGWTHFALGAGVLTQASALAHLIVLVGLVVLVLHKVVEERGPGLVFVTATKLRIDEKCKSIERSKMPTAYQCLANGLGQRARHNRSSVSKQVHFSSLLSVLEALRRRGSDPPPGLYWCRRRPLLPTS